MKSLLNDTKKHKKILLISHDFVVGGAPMSMLSVAKILKKEFKIDIWGLNSGELIEKYKDELGFKPRTIGNMFNYLNFRSKLKTFDFVYINTIVNYTIADICQNIGIPYMWIIREATNIPQIIKFFKINEEVLNKTLNSCQQSTYTVSDYAKKYIDKTYKTNIKVIHNFVEDTFVNKLKFKNEKLQFTVVGCYEKRKGIDILLEAIKTNSNKFILNICGDYKNKYAKSLFEATKNHANIYWHGIVLGEKKREIFENTDVFLVPSFDESCSRIVLESMMLGKPVVITENVGAKYMVNENTGWVVKTGNVESLHNCIEDIISNPECLYEKGKAAREMYLKTSTLEIYEKNLLKIINTELEQINSRKIFSLKIELNIFFICIKQQIKNTYEKLKKLIKKILLKFSNYLKKEKN